MEPPRLGINLEPDDGRLGIDFAGSSGNSSDDGSSELPWARNERAGTPPHYSYKSLYSKSNGSKVMTDPDLTIRAAAMYQSVFIFVAVSYPLICPCRAPSMSTQMQPSQFDHQ